MSDIQVKTARESQQGSAVFEFENGHTVTLVPYSHGWGYQVEGMRNFFLDYNGKRMVHYDGRLHRNGSCDDEDRFVMAEAGYDIERIVAYWEAARAYVKAEYWDKPLEEGRQHPEELWGVWMLSGRSGMSLAAVKAGHKPLPATTT